VLERTREIGILKSMGASKPTIVGVVLRECAVLAVVGVLVGIAGTYGVKELLDIRFPSFSFELTKIWIARGRASRLRARCAERFTPVGWRRGKTRSTRWRMNRR